MGSFLSKFGFLTCDTGTSSCSESSSNSSCDSPSSSSDNSPNCWSFSGQLGNRRVHIKSYCTVNVKDKPSQYDEEHKEDTACSEEEHYRNKCIMSTCYENTSDPNRYSITHAIMQVKCFPKFVFKPLGDDVLCQNKTKVTKKQCLFSGRWRARRWKYRRCRETLAAGNRLRWRLNHPKHRCLLNNNRIIPKYRIASRIERVAMSMRLSGYDKIGRWPDNNYCNTSRKLPFGRDIKKYFINNQFLLRWEYTHFERRSALASDTKAHVVFVKQHSKKKRSEKAKQERRKKTKPSPVDTAMEGILNEVNVVAIFKRLNKFLAIALQQLLDLQDRLSDILNEIEAEVFFPRYWATVLDYMTEVQQTLQHCKMFANNFNVVLPISEDIVVRREKEKRFLEKKIHKLIDDGKRYLVVLECLPDKEEVIESLRDRITQGTICQCGDNSLRHQTQDSTAKKQKRPSTSETYCTAPLFAEIEGYYDDFNLNGMKGKSGPKYNPNTMRQKTKWKTRSADGETAQPEKEPAPKLTKRQRKQLAKKGMITSKRRE